MNYFFLFGPIIRIRLSPLVNQHGRHVHKSQYCFHDQHGFHNKHGFHNHHGFHNQQGLNRKMVNVVQIVNLGTNLG